MYQQSYNIDHGRMPQEKAKHIVQLLVHKHHQNNNVVDAHVFGDDGVDPIVRQIRKMSLVPFEPRHTKLPRAFVLQTQPHQCACHSSKPGAILSFHFDIIVNIT